MITTISLLIFFGCVLIFLYDFFSNKKLEPISNEDGKMKLSFSSSSRFETEYKKYPITEKRAIPTPRSKIREVFFITMLASFFLFFFIICICWVGSDKEINLVLQDFYNSEKPTFSNPIELSNVRYFKIFRFFSAGVMDIAFGFISFYIWYMVHKRAFSNRNFLNFKFLRQLDYGLFFAGLYVCFLAITNFLQVNKQAQIGSKFIEDLILNSFSILNSIFLIISCIYFGHNFIFFKNTANKGIRIVISTIAISAVASFLCDELKFTGNQGAIGYFSNFDTFLSVIALVVFSIGVAISFYDKGYRRFLPAFSIFAGLCFILNQASHVHVVHNLIYGNAELKIEGNPILIFCNRIVGYTSEIFIGVLFLLIGKTWSTAYESGIDRAAVGIYKDILKMGENHTIKKILQNIKSPEKTIKSNTVSEELQRLLETEIAKHYSSQNSQYMSNVDYARCLIIVERKKIVRKELNIGQPDQIAVPVDIRTFITSEYEIERKVLSVQRNLLN